METQICKQCYIPKVLDDYYVFSRIYPNGKFHDSRRKICKKCQSNNSSISSKKKGNRSEQSRKWRKANPLKYRAKALIYSKTLSIEQRKTLSTRYIKTMLLTSLRKQGFTEIKFKDIPEELVNLKRKQLTLKRKLKQNG
jgi:hypothetical protein